MLSLVDDFSDFLPFQRNSDRKSSYLSSFLDQECEQSYGAYSNVSTR
jgi:hypothetical protein